MQCKDIPDGPILDFLLRHYERWCTWDDSDWMPTVQDAMPPGTPPKLQLAKMRRLIQRKLVDGCDCGCRGDFCLPGSPLSNNPDDGALAQWRARIAAMQEDATPPARTA